MSEWDFSLNETRISDVVFKSLKYNHVTLSGEGDNDRKVTPLCPDCKQELTAGNGMEFRCGCEDPPGSFVIKPPEGDDA